MPRFALKMQSEPRSGSDPGDAEIVALVRGGSADAYRLLVARHQSRLYRYAVRMLNDDEAAADLVQNALIRAFERLPQCREPERFGSWVLAILANDCRHAVRRARPHLPLDTLRQQTASDDPARAAEESDMRAQLSRALLQLPVQQREAFLLRHMEGWSYEDMVPVTGASVSALKQRVHRAREMLGEILKEIQW